MNRGKVPYHVIVPPMKSFDIAAAEKINRSPLVRAYEYKCPNGELAYCMLRFAGPDGKKIIRPYSFGNLGNPATAEWCCKAPENGRFLFNLPELARRRLAPVLVVEGEKTAEAASAMLPEFVVITSMFSGSGIVKTDWSPLAGRSVVIWPDNDEPGKKYATAVAEQLGEVAASQVTVVTVPPFFPECWDLADPLPSRANIQLVRELIASATAAVAVEKKGKVSTSEKDNAAKLVEAILNIPVLDIFRDQNGEPFVQVPSGNATRNVPLRSYHFKRFISHYFYKQVGEVLSKDRLDRVMPTLEARAQFDGEEHCLYLRNKHADSCVTVDLGSSFCRIAASGWTLVDQAPLAFRRHQTFKPLPLPDRGGEIDQIFNFVNIPREEDQLLLIAFLGTALLSEIAHPMLTIIGPQGSAKTTLSCVIQELVDPCLSSSLHLGKVEDFIQAASHRYVVALDNIGSLTADQSNLLCKFITGVGVAKRALYTDDEDIERCFRRIVIATAINSPITKPDLLDRSIILELDPVPAVARRQETSILEEFRAARPTILGALYDVVSHALAIESDIKLTSLPRMADFAKWGYAVTQAAGRDGDVFLQAYEKNVATWSDDAIEGSPVGRAVVRYLESAPTLEGTPTEVLGSLRGKSGIGADLLPRCPRLFGKKVTEIVPCLARLGYIVDISRGRKRRISICRPSGHEAR